MKQILMNTDMVRALLEGRKTVTRRVVKPQPPSGVQRFYAGNRPDLWRSPGTDAWVEIRAPYGPGDILWVRETWGMASDLLGAVPGPVYMADYSDFELRKLREKGYRWRPSIHMPREAARIFLQVTGVRVERLQDINLDPPGPKNQVIKEGCRRLCDFIAVWEMAIKKTDRSTYGWEANPWVWVIEFEQISKEEAVRLCHG